MSRTRSASVVIVDVTLGGSIGTALAVLLAGFSERTQPWRLEVSYFHKPSADEPTLTEMFSASLPDVVLLVLHRDLHERHGELLKVLKVKLAVPIVVAVSD